MTIPTSLGFRMQLHQPRLDLLNIVGGGTGCPRHRERFIPVGVEIEARATDRFLGRFRCRATPRSEGRQLGDAVGGLARRFRATPSGVENFADISGVPPVDLLNGNGHDAAV